MMNCANIKNGLMHAWFACDQVCVATVGNGGWVVGQDG